MDKELSKIMRKYGLIGRNISYSFSENYFKNKFSTEGITDAQYLNFDIQQISDLKDIISKNANLKGLNVTIPYKEEVIPYLDSIDKKAKKIGAVNTIKITKKGKLKGYNTDYFGFNKSIKPFLEKHHKKALILGTGGASKAIKYGLKKLHVDFKTVSRTKSAKNLTYSDLNQDLMENHTIIINCSPVGTYPNIGECPDIPYNFIHENHLLYDLVYNPEETLFMKRGKLQGAKTCNGYKMLVLQAEKSWEIWNS